MAETVAILGGGVMGETLVSGLLRAGWSPDEVVVSERRPERAAELAERYAVRTTTNTDAAASSDTVVLVVKPQDIEGLLVQIAEYHQDAVTAISGSGPAYIFYVVEAMIEAGVLLGLPRSTSTELVVQTLFGAATMLRETGQHPTVLREQVSSPAGTTMAALRQLDDHKVRAAFLTAMEAARDRSRELSAGNA